MKIKESKVNEFVKQLKSLGVEYDSINEKHWIGSKMITDDKNVITNSEMKVMCSNYFERDYDLLTNTQQTKVRIYVFKMLRGGESE